MKKTLLLLTLFFSVALSLYSQETTSDDGVVSFALPIRNSLKFNRHLINPTFSFVREQSTFVSFYNKDNGCNLIMHLKRICLAMPVG